MILSNVVHHWLSVCWSSDCRYHSAWSQPSGELLWFLYIFRSHSSDSAEKIHSQEEEKEYLTYVLGNLSIMAIHTSISPQLDLPSISSKPHISPSASKASSKYWQIGPSKPQGSLNLLKTWHWCLWYGIFILSVLVRLIQMKKMRPRSTCHLMSIRYLEFNDQCTYMPSRRRSCKTKSFPSPLFVMIEPDLGRLRHW